MFVFVNLLLWYYHFRKKSFVIYLAFCLFAELAFIAVLISRFKPLFLGWYSMLWKILRPRQLI